MALLLPNGKQGFTGALGLPLVGGKLYTYAAGTSTLKATFTDAAGTIPNTNPVILDARGEAVIFWDGAYKIRLTDALGNNIWPSVDGISTIDPLTATVAALYAPGGAANIGYQPPGVSVVNRDVRTKLRERVSFEDLGAIGDGNADDGATINAAIYARYSGLATSQSMQFVEIYGTSGKVYKFATPVSVRQNRIRFIGNGAAIVCTGAYAFDFTQDGSTNINEAGAVIGWKITGATGAAVRTRASAFTELCWNWITGCADGYDVGAIGAIIEHNYIRSNTGAPIALRATTVSGGGIVESQRCVVQNNRIYQNGSGLQLLQGGGHYIAGNDSELNGSFEILMRCSFGNFILGHYAEPTGGATAVILIDNVTAGLPSIPGRTSAGNQIIGGTFGGGALNDIQVNGGNNTYMGAIRIGTGNIYIAAGVLNTTIDRFALPPTVTDLGTDTVNFNTLFDGQGIKLKSTQGVYVNGIKVVSAQQSGIATIGGGTAPNDAINAIILALRGYGLIAP